MPLTKVSFSVIQVANNVTSTTVGNTTSIPSFTFDQNGVISAVSNTAISGAGITANTVANSAFQTGSVENYMRGAGLGFGMRNRIINGAMVIDQRNAGANVTLSNNGSSFITDRFRADAPIDQSMTFQQQTSVIPTGFSYALKVTAGTATSNTSNQPGLFHFVEGYNTADLGFGTANAKTITLSFWVRSSLTGTFGVCFENNDSSRAYIASYTINSANTFEYKTITIAGDTSGTWNTTNQRGMTVIFDLGYGTTFSAAASSAWANLSNARGLTSGVKLAANTGATWFITGVQLEVGSTATSFDYRPYGTELALCQRYFQKSFATETAPANGLGDYSFQWNSGGAYNVITSQLKVSMRATSTNTFYNPRSGGTAGYMTDGTNDYTVRNSNWNNNFVGIDSYPQGALSSKTLYVMWTSSAEL